MNADLEVGLQAAEVLHELLSKEKSWPEAVATVARRHRPGPAEAAQFAALPDRPPLSPEFLAKIAAVGRRWSDSGDV